MLGANVNGRIFMGKTKRYDKRNNEIRMSNKRKKRNRNKIKVELQKIVGLTNNQLIIDDSIYE